MIAFSDRPALESPWRQKDAQRVNRLLCAAACEGVEVSPKTVSAAELWNLMSEEETLVLALVDQVGRAAEPCSRVPRASCSRLPVSLSACLVSRPPAHPPQARHEQPERRRKSIRQPPCQPPRQPPSK